jgi:regulator of protease activity HflC (stomatin/prohibitin superfamily)
MEGFIFTLLGCMGFILFILVLSAFRVVQQNRVQIVQRFGKYANTLDSGLNLIVPVIDKVVADISLAMQNQIYQIDTVSKDKVSIRLKANLIYSIDRASVTKYYYELNNPLETLTSIVENYVRSYVSSQTHEELLERREEISEYLIKHLDEKMKVWGIKISSFQVMDIVFPTEITDAMSKVVASQRLKEAAMNEAESAKIRVVKQAEAEKESRILLGEGVAGERRAIIDGLKESIDDMKQVSGIDTKEVMNLVVISQYFDTVRAVGESSNAKIMFMNPAPSGANDLVQSLSSAIEAAKDEAKQK